MTILDTISWLTSIYIHIAPSLIRYTLTTIYYPSCQQISGCYHIRVQSYSQSIYIQQSNWVIFDHFGHYFLINFNLYSYWTKFNSIHINYNILFILSTNFRLLSHTSAKLIHKVFIYSNQIGSFLTILDTISWLTSIYIHIGLSLIRYTLTTIYYSSCQQISGCYHIRVQADSQRIYIQQSNWVIFDHFGHYFLINFNLYSYWTKFNSIHINYNILSILSTNFRLLSYTSASWFTKNLYTAIKLGHFWPFWTLFPD